MLTGIFIVYLIGVLVFITAFVITDHQDREEDSTPTFKEVMDYLSVSAIWPVLIAMSIIRSL
ncbi:hypothetical protein [Aeromonas phage AS-yj]|uniref:Uncharacterized protein n=1 Tax=Aeromonas phage AS-yj TaxID=2026115 RepID=A0A291LE92_9CAUD|nr:hypothetical protein [Aeromonas phage AS-yj]